jgi:diguanylate cyclase (GGDEF)-like protein
MSLHLRHLPKLILQRRRSAIFGVLVILALWASVVFKYAQDKRSDLNEAQRASQSFAILFAENALRTVAEIDSLLLFVRHGVETRGDATDYSAILRATEMFEERIGAVSIIDRQGVIRASTAAAQPSVGLSARRQVSAPQDGQADRLYIGKPSIGRAGGQWWVQFSRRFLNADGTFGGVVVASLDSDRFTKFADGFALPPSGAVAVIGADGVIRAAEGRSGELMPGQDIHASGLFARMQRGVDVTFEQTNPSSGVRRLVALRKVRDQPLWVSVSLGDSDSLAGAWANWRFNSTAALALTLAVLAAMEWMLRLDARRRRQAAMLELVSDGMSQGITPLSDDLDMPVVHERGVALLTPRVEFVDLVHTVCDRRKRVPAEAHNARSGQEDAPTGVGNRRGLGAALAAIHRQDIADCTADERVECAILLLDLDRFRLVSDTLGHRIGDLLLKTVAERLRAALHATDILTGFGGDRFAVMVRCAKSHSALADLAHGLIDAIGKPCHLGGYRVLTSVSIGIAVAPNDGAKVDDLLLAAALALAAAKQQARGGFRFYQPAMSNALSDRRQTELDLREAIAGNELELYYQPIVGLRNNSITGFEALARWRHRTKGVVAPADFIPLAEESGLIVKLGEWALTEACAKIARLSAELKVAVNLSPLQFAAPNLVHVVRRALIESGMAPHRLELEITERLLLENDEQTLSMLRRLRRLGIGIVLDDFGTGYSALSYLRKFPLDGLKIDRSFLLGLAEGTEQAAIIKAVLGIARALQMKVTAEGVETTDQRDFLKTVGCNHAQGYLFGAPVPFAHLAEILAPRSAGRILAA